MNETLPVGVVNAPVTVALSCTVEPIGADVITSCAALWMSVAVDELSLPPVSGSHGPVDPL